MILLWLAFALWVMSVSVRERATLNVSVQKHTFWSCLHTKLHRAYSQSYANSLQPWHTNMTILSRKWYIVSVSRPAEMFKYSHALQKTMERLFIWTKVQQLNSKSPNHVEIWRSTGDSSSQTPPWVMSWIRKWVAKGRKWLAEGRKWLAKGWPILTAPPLCLEHT